MLEQRVRYITSGELLEDLTAALADQTIHDRVRFYAKFGLLIIDEFGFDRIERANLSASGQLVVQDHRRPQPAVSTALVTNIDFESWADYLGDAPLAMAMLDRVVDGATIVKLKGKSYRVHRGGEEPTEQVTAAVLRSLTLHSPRPATPTGPLSSRETGPLLNREGTTGDAPAPQTTRSHAEVDRRAGPVIATDSAVK